MWRINWHYLVLCCLISHAIRVAGCHPPPSYFVAFVLRFGFYIWAFLGRCTARFLCWPYSWLKRTVFNSVRGSISTLFVGQLRLFRWVVFFLRVQLSILFFLPLFEGLFFLQRGHWLLVVIDCCTFFAEGWDLLVTGPHFLWPSSWLLHPFLQIVAQLSLPRESPRQLQPLSVWPLNQG
jgi:hypothetical protein